MAYITINIKYSYVNYQDHDRDSNNFNYGDYWETNRRPEFGGITNCDKEACVRLLLDNRT